MDIEQTIKELQDPSTLRLHMGELTSEELLIAQAAVRFAVVKLEQKRHVAQRS